MNKTNNTLLFMSLGAMIISGILVIRKPGRHHKGLGENTGKNIDNRLKDLAAALDKATQFVHKALNHTS
jgi:hypothetical protein